MIRWFFPLTLMLLPINAFADMIVTNRTIRAKTILAPDDLILKQGEYPGATDQLKALIGQETRVTLYAGRPIQLSDVGPPAVVERNQIVRLSFQQNGLNIITEGRALARAGAGELIRVMNLTSRNTVMGIVQPNGHIIVSK